MARYRAARNILWPWHDQSRRAQTASRGEKKRTKVSRPMRYLYPLQPQRMATVTFVTFTRPHAILALINFTRSAVSPAPRLPGYCAAFELSPVCGLAFAESAGKNYGNSIAVLYP